MAGNVVRIGRKQAGRQARNRMWRFALRSLGPCLMLAPFGVAAPLLAQPVVQPLPGGNTQALNAALARLARDPRDLGALIDAGNAALQMGDVDAATGFFARADQLSPNNMKVKAGLAAALVRSENPFDAIPLFAEAEKGGAMDPMLEAERGLAYDLVGDTATAQRFYRQSLETRPSDETLRRLALSQAIAGDRAGMEQTLSPLLQKQDKAAWRTRAFALAILNRPDEAVTIANQSMPAELANGIAPYLRYMPKLTAAQQAAAANFGRFPRAADIGRDDPRVALYAPPRRVASADAALVPAGEPLGRGRTRAKGKQAAAPAPVSAPRSAPPEIMPERQVSPAPPLAVAPASAPPPASAATPPPGVRVPVFAPVPPAASKPASAPAPAVRPAPAIPASTTRSASAAKPAPAPQPARPARVADAFGDLAVPTGSAAPAPGAVDVRKIAAAKPKPVEPPKPAHPSRIWVQVGTGRNVGALAFTWRGLAKDNPQLFRGRSALTSDWGRTNRLLTGPFPSESAAQAFVAKLKKAGLDAFEWLSPAGQVVDDLPGT